MPWSMKPGVASKRCMLVLVLVLVLVLDAWGEVKRLPWPCSAMACA